MKEDKRKLETAELSAEEEKSVSGGYSLQLSKRRVRLLKPAGSAAKPSLTNVKVCSGCHGCTNVGTRIGRISNPLKL